METPFICNINALDAVQTERYKEIILKLNSERQSVKELKDGYAFRFKAEPQLIRDVAEFIVYERLCCPFFDWRSNRILIGFGCACAGQEKELKNLSALNLSSKTKSLVY